MRKEKQKNYHTKIIVKKDLFIKADILEKVVLTTTFSKMSAFMNKFPNYNSKRAKNCSFHIVAIFFVQIP